MITALGIGEPVKGVIGQLPYEDERFLLFKDTLNPEILREICLYREGSKWNVNYLLMDKFRDEVLHRLAFARAMSVQELADIDYWIYEQRAAASKKTPKQMNKDIKGADTHTVIIQKLRRIFWNRNWGFTFNHFLPKESFYYANESLDNAEKLCPVYCYLKKQSDEEYSDYQRERLLTAAVPVLKPAERSPRGEMQTKEQSELLHTLETLLGKGKFGMWFDESTAGISDDAVVLTVKNKFAADWVTNELQGAVLEAAAQVCGKERAVVIAAADGKYKKTLRTLKPAETAPVKEEPLKYSEVLEQIEAKEKQAEPQKTKPVVIKPEAIELTQAEKQAAVQELFDEGLLHNKLSRAECDKLVGNRLELVLLQK
ncbi:hypothetical protein FACS18942_04060 [Planctomycetales bacterium]|nr:hypothetical protein FACS18942_04060 [Planctomycetales bacterium]GHT34657.1 hypothetical protein FACS189427_02370 [Planctomycetales bacterium]